MKFGKEFVAQTVPEWQDAYMDYCFLKTLLKDVQRSKQQVNPFPAAISPVLKRKMSLYRAFSGLTRRGSYRSLSSDTELQTITVSTVRRDGLESYETTFLMGSEVGGEYETVFFRRLDDEFNKVESFYKAKVKEAMDEAALLDKQMDSLIAFRVKVDHPIGWSDRSEDITSLASEVAASAASLSASASSASRRCHVLEVIEEGPSVHEKSERGSITEDQEEKDETPRDNGDEGKKLKRYRPPPLEILDRVKINNTIETPRSTIKGILKVPQQTELVFSRENLKKIEDRLKKAFVVFYNKLRLLKSYSFLNTLAFSKIMKKYDKITSRNASKAYMKMVDNSYLGNSDEITKLMDRVERTFIKHFSNSNRSKGMIFLRPRAKSDRHRTTFSMGFLVGSAAALVIALIVLIHARKIMSKPGRIQYMNNMFPLYSLFGLIILHVLTYAANVYLWRRYRVNYAFIFGFKQGTELGYRQVLLVGAGLAVLALGSIISNVDMEMDPKTMDYQALTELLPLILLILLVIIIFLPFDILYRSSRFFFLRCIFRCICAPLYKVTLPDFFLADQLTSQVQAIRSLEFYVCYYGWGDYKHRHNTCKENDVYNTFYFIVAVVPYWIRLLQCLRRLFEEKDVVQGYNGLKYFLTIVAVCARTAYTMYKGLAWKITAWLFSAVSAVFCTYWDLVLDWGLLQRHSKNLWLRDKLLVPDNRVYYVAIVLDVLLRFAWLQTVLNFRITSLHDQIMTAIVASLEIIRRGIWNFFRLENEHLNNVGRYRAFKTVPLPFNYDEDEEKDG